MKVQIKKATREGLWLKMALMGPTGSGKTYSALAIASGLGSRICVLDTERGSASLYSDKFDFSVVDDLPDYHPQNYIDVMKAVVAEGFDVLVIDSLTHAWNGKGGILEIVDDLTANSRSKNAYTTGWPTGTRLQNELLDCILTSPIHIIVTMRSKMDYVLQDDGNGKKAPVKVGLAPVQRDGVEYEFTIIGDLNLNHSMAITKTRLVDLDGRIIKTPGPDFGAYLKEWLGTAPAPAPAPAPVPVPAPVPATVPASQVLTAPSPATQTAPSSSVSAGKSPEWDAAYEKAIDLTNLFREKGMNGYGDIHKLRADIKLALGVDSLRDADLDGINTWILHLKNLMSNSDTPFSNVAPAPAPAPASQSEPAGPVYSQEIMDAISRFHEVAAQHVVPKSSLNNMKMVVAEHAAKGNLTGITNATTMLAGYKKRVAPVSETVTILRKQVSETISHLVNNSISGFERSDRMTDTMAEHLGVTKLSECADEAKLQQYLTFLCDIKESA